MSRAHPVLSPAALRLLSVASAQPRTPDELEITLARRGTVLFMTDAARRKTLEALVRHGYLVRSGGGVRGQPHAYTLTPAGEETLDRHWRAA